MSAFKIAIFALTFSLGSAAAAITRYEAKSFNRAGEMYRGVVNHDCHNTFDDSVKPQCRNESKYPPSGSGTSAGSSHVEWPPAPGDDSNAKLTIPLKVLSKKKANYTDLARANGIEGSVTLRVTFLASGGIGSITTLKGLPFGLTEQAGEAARGIEFEPEKVNGVPRTTSRPVSYTFSLY